MYCGLEALESIRNVFHRSFDDGNISCDKIKRYRENATGEAEDLRNVETHGDCYRTK